MKVIWAEALSLGEGPVWDPREGVLWFVDIKAREVHRLDPASGDHRRWSAPAQIGWIFPARDGTMLAGLKTGLSRFDPITGSFAHLAVVEPDLPSNRLNDATVAPDGQVWFGSMDDEEKEQTGRFYRWDGQAVVSTEVAPVCITNGPAISPDGAILFHVDTVGGLIHSAPIDGRGVTGPSRQFVAIAPEDGHPDGVTVDSAGNVWVGIWGGACARCYGPDGKLLRQVDLPASNITKVALGGPDLKTAYATSASIGLSEEALAREPSAGSVFAFEVDVPGQPVPLARI